LERVKVRPEGLELRESFGIGVGPRQKFFRFFLGEAVLAESILSEK